VSEVRVIEGDCLQVLPTLEAGSFDAVITDPPYGLGFMGADWDKPRPAGRVRDRVDGRTNRKDGGKSTTTTPESYVGGSPFQQWCEEWASAALHALKPGGYLLAFGGTRTYHRMTCAIEDAGFEIRDCLMWLYGQGFPKGQGCLKPGYEPIILARKPGKRVLSLSIDECRVGTEERANPRCGLKDASVALGGGWRADMPPKPCVGRWPANLLHDGSDEVLEAFAAFGEKTSGSRKAGEYQPQGYYGNAIAARPDGMERGMPALDGDTGTAARFFYTAKASKKERGEGNSHPTVKPLALMRWLARLATPPGGTVLDPFGGSGTTGVAALMEGRNAVLIEREPAYVEIIRNRLAETSPPLFAEGVA
jgi:DNA modification methylase